MIERRTARIVLLDHDDRVLLMEVPASPALDQETDYVPSVWVTLGGGIHPGESVEAAARRELKEETGITDAVLHGVIWHGEQNLETAKGLTHLDESFVLARTAAKDWSSVGWSDNERELVRSLRWWSLPELRVHSEIIKPPRLNDLLLALLGGTQAGPPREIQLKADP